MNACRFAAPLAAAISLAGCAVANIQSARSPDYNKTPQRLFIVADFGETFQNKIVPHLLIDDDRGTIQQKFTSTLKSCGVETNMEIVESLAFHLTLDKKIKEFSPDSILYIQWKSGLKHGGSVINPNYHVDLKDLPSNVIVWDENIQLESAFDNTGAFAQSIINRMAEDRVLPASCAIK